MTNRTIEIENLTDRTIEYRIDHQTVCVKVGRCFCTKGRRGPVTSSVIVPGKRRTGQLDPSVALIPQVRVDATGPKPKIRIIGAAPAAEMKAQVSDGPKSKPTSVDKGSGRKGSRE